MMKQQNSAPARSFPFAGALILALMLLAACTVPTSSLQPAATGAAPAVSEAPAASETATGTEQAAAAEATAPAESPTEAAEPTEGPAVTVGPPDEPLDPLKITKYSMPLWIPPVMAEADAVGFNYEVGMRQFEQQVLPPDLPQTTVWSYGLANVPEPESGPPASYHWPGNTFDLKSDETVLIKWVNQLVDEPLEEDSDFRPLFFGDNAEVPAAILPYVHGAHWTPSEQGAPEGWFLPVAANLPDGAAPQGPLYRSAEDQQKNAAVFEYPNHQRGANLWYHDRSLELFALHAYSGLSGMYILHDRDEAALDLPLPYPKLGDEAGTRYYDIPLNIADRSFFEDGNLRYDPDEDGFYGDTLLVNGNTWPYLEVEPRLYRFRLVNSANARVLLLRFDVEGFTFHQIGNDGGLLPDKPIELDELILAPGERADILVDFTRFKDGVILKLLNFGPDGPFKELPVPEEDVADPDTTGQVMQFRVVELTREGRLGSVPERLPAIEALKSDLPARDLLLGAVNGETGQYRLGTLAEGLLDYSAASSETLEEGQVEVWNLVNLSEEAQVIHLQGLSFQIVGRRKYDVEKLLTAEEDYLAEKQAEDLPILTDFWTEEPEQPMPGEKGWKDTVIVYPSSVTQIIFKAEAVGNYYWQSTLLERADRQMLRPFAIEAR